MSYQLETDGGPGKGLARQVNEHWMTTAAKAGIDLSGFDPTASLDNRVAWALSSGLVIAVTYLRFSSKLQNSDGDQARANTTFAAENAMYLPPEFVCVDRAVTGRRLRRAGLQRMTDIMQDGVATVLLVFTLSRLSRKSYEAFRFIEREIVESGGRAVAVSQGIDTSDARAWKLKVQVHSMMDEMLLEAIAEHCREGLVGLFQKQWTTGALAVGYRPVEVPGAPPTKLGRPRTMPQVDPEVATLIRQHFEWIRDGLPITEGWRRWVAAGGPCDPRSTIGRMSDQAYRRMLSRVEYTGRWQFGRKRNQFSSKLDYTKQVDQPESQWDFFLCEELRIIDDQLFLEVQQRLAKLKLGPRGPKKGKHDHLWDLTTELFYCAHCSTPDNPVRFYQTGAHGKGMQCKNAVLCKSKSAVNRKQAVRAVCLKLTELLHRDRDLLCEIICREKQLDAEGDHDLAAEISKRQEKIRTMGCHIDDLRDLAGHGSKDDRAQTKAKIRAAQTERGACQLELTKMQNAAKQASKPITAEDVNEILANFTTLLEDAVAGKLGEKAVYETRRVLELLVGGRIWVYVEPRPGRKQKNVRGVFRPNLVSAVRAVADVGDPGGNGTAEEVEVWLREPPLIDRLAERAAELVDKEDRSYGSAANVMRKDGHDVNSDKVWQLRKRHYEMLGQPAPERPYNGGQPRGTA